MASYRDELIDNLTGKLFAKNLLNTQDYNDTDNLIDTVSSVIKQALINVVLVRGEILD